MSSALYRVLSIDGDVRFRRSFSSICNACTSRQGFWRDAGEEESDLVASEALLVLGWCLVLEVGLAPLLNPWSVYVYLQHDPQET